MESLLSKSAVTKIQGAIVAIIIIIALIGGVYYATLLGSSPSPPSEKRFLRWQSLIGYSDPAVGSDEPSTGHLINLYDTLIYPNLTGILGPRLAESWEASEDVLTWTFHLRHGVKFHDGSELIAEDVKFSMDRLITIGEGFSYLLIPYIESSTVLDNYAVQFKLKQPLGPFLGVLVRLFVLNKDLVMAHVEKPGPYGEYGDYAMPWLLEHDAGSGPYQIKDVKIGAYLVMERFKDYWGDFAANAPDEVTSYVITDAVTLQTLMARREIELTNDAQDLETYQAMDEIEGVNVSIFDAGNQEFYAMLNTKKPPTDDVHFRKAMAWAMDYETVVNYIYPNASLAQGPVPKKLPGHNPDVLQYHRDLEKAREELALSKYAENYTLYTVEVHWCSEMGPYEKIAILFAESMADIGINVKVVAVPWLSIIDEMGKQETSPHVEFLSVQASYAEAGSLLEARYHSKSAATWEQNEWLLNSTIDAMIEDALRTVDQATRFEKYYEIQEDIMNLCPSLFLFDTAMRRAYQSYYVDWPAARGQLNPIPGYAWDFRYFSVYPEKRDDLLK